MVNEEKSFGKKGRGESGEGGERFDIVRYFPHTLEKDETPHNSPGKF